MATLIPGKAAEIAPSVWRLLALNPGMMTGPGTNTYLLGQDTLTVLDPGPADPEHIDNILSTAQSLNKPIQRIVVTHTHRDHSPGAQLLKAALTEVTLLGPQPVDDGLQDEQWQPDLVMHHGHTVTISPGMTLEAIATPGHVDNHYCYLLQEAQLLFSGDHLIHGSTVVIAPPSGNMKRYIASLEKLLDYPIRVMAPGHGELIEAPQQVINTTVAHRLKREHKVIEALGKQPGSTAAGLVPNVYDDVPAFLHGVAQLSLTAHLIKLEEDGTAIQDNGHWKLL